jgi:hypothetical protein
MQNGRLTLLPFVERSPGNVTGGHYNIKYNRSATKMETLGKNDVPCILQFRLYGLVVRVLGYRSGGPGSIPGTTRIKSSLSGTGSTQLREYN